MIGNHPSPSTPHQQPHEWSKKAIISTILACIGFTTLWLGVGLLVAAIGAVYGHLAKHEIAIRPLLGKRLASFGLILSYGSLLLFPLLVLIVSISLPAINKWRTDQDAGLKASSTAKASRLFVACEAYARANRDRYPAEWVELSGAFLPAKELAELLQSPYPESKGVAFTLVPHERPILEAISDSVIVIQENAPSEIPEIAVVYANGTTTRLFNPAYEKP